MSRVAVILAAVGTVVVLAALSGAALTYVGPLGLAMWATFGIAAVAAGLVSAARGQGRLALYFFAVAIGMAVAAVVTVAAVVWGLAHA